MVKSLLYNFIYKIWEIPQFLYINKVKNCQFCFVIDIDNTLTVNALNSKLNHKNPTPRKSMILYVKNLLLQDYTVIYLSTRDFRLYLSTIKWLSKHQILKRKCDVFLVPKAESKLLYLDILIRNNNNIIYIDDLSYGHEKGYVTKYEHIIEIIKKKQLDYKGIEFIEKFE